MARDADGRRRFGPAGLVVAAALVFALAFAAAPWFAFRAVRSAAQNQDIQALGQLIDYPAVRAGLKAQMAPSPAAQLPPPDILSDPIGAMRRALQSSVQPAPSVDAWLTPGAIARMAAGLPPVGVQAAAGRTDWPHYVYWDTGRCRLSVAPAGARGPPTVFTFERRGLFKWTLVQIRLPAGAAPR